MSRYSSVFVALIAIAWGMFPAVAEEPLEFRVDTEVKIGGATQTAYETLTIFTRDLAFDFSRLEGKPAEKSPATLFDPNRGRVTLLDPDRAVKCGVTTERLVAFCATYKTIEAKSKLFDFCNNPDFQVNHVAGADALTLKSDVLTYSLRVAKPQRAGVEKAYHQFADWSARLNAMRPGQLPPFARLQLNKEVASRGLIPVEVERQTIGFLPLAGARRDTIRTYHDFNWVLSKEDRDRVTMVEKWLTEFQEVPYEEFYPELKQFLAKEEPAKSPR